MKAKKKDIIPEISSLEDIKKELGQRIRAERKKQANNYEDFAKTHNLNKVTVSRVEQGKTSSLDSILAVARAAGINIEDLFRGIQ